mgnify:CR=1 FL=1
MKKVVISVIVVTIVFISLFICAFKALKKDKKNSELKEIEVNETINHLMKQPVISIIKKKNIKK